jgi:signal transduction histidine kinase
LTSAGKRKLFQRPVQKIKAALTSAFEPDMIVPVLMGALAFLTSYRFALPDNYLNGLIPNEYVEHFFYSVNGALYVYIPFAIITYLRAKFKNQLSGGFFYFLSTSISISTSAFLGLISFNNGIFFVLDNAVRLLIAAFMLALLAGQYRKFLASELIHSMGLLDRLEEQRKSLIESEEKVRREIADLLHNSIQAKLVVSATKLDQIRYKAPDSLAPHLKSVISELEYMRIFDVRNASRALSPEIGIFGLNQCLEDLARTYSGVMRITFAPSDLSDEAESATGLAIYRICEQGFLNALTHGQAKNCEVRFWAEKGWVHLTIDNDGLELSEAYGSAGGSAKIDAWVASFGGTWVLRNLDFLPNSSGGLVRLEARLCLDPRQVDTRADGLVLNPALKNRRRALS